MNASTSTLGALFQILIWMLNTFVVKSGLFYSCKPEIGFSFCLLNMLCHLQSYKWYISKNWFGNLSLFLQKVVVLLLKNLVLSVRTGFFLSWAPLQQVWLPLKCGCKVIPIPPRWTAQMVGCPKVVSVFPFPDNRGSIPGLMSVNHRVFGGYNLQGPEKFTSAFLSITFRCVR